MVSLGHCKRGMGPEPETGWGIPRKFGAPLLSRSGASRSVPCCESLSYSREPPKGDIRRGSGVECRGENVEPDPSTLEDASAWSRHETSYSITQLAHASCAEATSCPIDPQGRLSVNSKELPDPQSRLSSQRMISLTSIGEMTCGPGRFPHGSSRVTSAVIGSGCSPLQSIVVSSRKPTLHVDRQLFSGAPMIPQKLWRGAVVYASVQNVIVHWSQISTSL